MTAHKHAEIIKAKADNMELVVLIKRSEVDLVLLRKRSEVYWIEVADQSEIFIKQNSEYFLCLPQHKEACLHWLNGGEVEFFEHCKWHTINSKIEWASDHLFMGEMFKSRIKPRKEIRHIYISTLGTTTYAKKTKEEAAREVSIMGGSFDVWKHYEIEIDVEV